MITLRFPHFWIFYIIHLDLALPNLLASLGPLGFNTPATAILSLLAHFFCTETDLLVLQPWSLSSIWNRFLGSSPRSWAGWFSSPQNHLFYFPLSTKLGQFVIDLLTEPILSEFLSLLFLFFPFNILCPPCQGSLLSLLSWNHLFVPSNPPLSYICMNSSLLSSFQHLPSHHFLTQLVVCIWQLANKL